MCFGLVRRWSALSMVLNSLSLFLCMLECECVSVSVCAHVLYPLSVDPRMCFIAVTYRLIKLKQV